MHERLNTNLLIQYTFMPKQIERPISKLHNDQDYASKYDVNCIVKDYHWKKILYDFISMNECDRFCFI